MSKELPLSINKLQERQRRLLGIIEQRTKLPQKIDDRVLPDEMLPKELEARQKQKDYIEQVLLPRSLGRLTTALNGVSTRLEELSRREEKAQRKIERYRHLLSSKPDATLHVPGKGGK